MIKHLNIIVVYEGPEGRWDQFSSITWDRIEDIGGLRREAKWQIDTLIDKLQAWREDEERQGDNSGKEQKGIGLRKKILQGFKSLVDFRR